jgi:hypothetical protein
MILVFEMVWTGTHHAPGNSATIQTIATAFPDQPVRVFADTSHLDELRDDPALTGHTNVSFQAVSLSAHYRFRPQIVSLRRLWREWLTLWAALAAVPPKEPTLIVLISATPTAIFAAARLARMTRRRIGVQVGLHGNLNDAYGWRPRNPLLRALDLRAALTARHGGQVRFLVLEPTIRQALAESLPAILSRTDVLPLPINQAELARVPDPALRLPLQIGLVGQATEAKGIIPFLAMACRFRKTHPGQVEFHLVGRAPPGSELSRFAPLASPVSTDPLPRAAFVAALSRLHFVCLPLQSGYYDLSASGALIDAVTWLKPVIASDRPILRDLFSRFGDLGYLCADTAAMQAAITAVLATMDTARYASQTETLRRVRASRTPAALAPEYARLVMSGFPSLFALASPSGI